MTQRKKARILVVEDEPSLLNTILFTLKRRGYEVDGFVEGLGALESLKESTRRGEAFDLLITDIQIPLLDGQHLLEAARGKGVPTPVLVITGHGSTVLKKKMEQLGIVGWLDKPFSQEELLKQVQEILFAGKTGTKNNGTAKQGGNK